MEASDPAAGPKRETAIKPLAPVGNALVRNVGVLNTPLPPPPPPLLLAPASRPVCAEGATADTVDVPCAMVRAPNGVTGSKHAVSSAAPPTRSERSERSDQPPPPVADRGDNPPPDAPPRLPYCTRAPPNAASHREARPAAAVTVREVHAKNPRATAPAKPTAPPLPLLPVVKAEEEYMVMTPAPRP